MVQLQAVLSKFYDEYQNNTPKKLKLVDSYLAYVLLTGILQFVYCCLVGTFPFNSFLSGFISTVSCFVLGGEINENRLVFDRKLNFPLFQSASASSQTPRTNRNSLESRRKEDLLTSSSPTSSSTSWSSTSSVKLARENDKNSSRSF
jgi:hypothetical protein